MRRTLLLVALLSGAATSAGAHSAGSPAPGLEIPALTHGQMQVIAGHRAAILTLADRQGQTDPRFRRLMNHARLQHTYCLWSLMPGSVSDEASPFNACTHAALAASLALLDHMETMPAAADAANTLHHAIDGAMMAAGTASELCAHSATTFSTGAVVTPDWRALPGHSPSLAVVLGGIALLGAPLLVRRR